MTSKTALINLLREKGDQQLSAMLINTEHKAHTYKKMLNRNKHLSARKLEEEVEKANETLVEEVSAPIIQFFKKKKKNK